MKTIFHSVAVLSLVIAALLAGVPRISSVYAQAPAPATPTGQPNTTCDSSRSITVTGSAAINILPDRALLRLGVQSNGVTVDGVQFDNDRAIETVLEAIKKQGVNPADISTNNYFIQPVYEDYDSLFIKGYRINNSVSVTVRDVTQTAGILAAALKAGANQVDDVSFYTSDLRKYRDQARELAMTAAREKAAALTSSAGTKTGCVLNINENSWSYFNNPWYSGSRGSSQMTQNVIQNALPAESASSTADGSEPVSTGMISVKAEVTVVYSLQ